MRRRALTAAAVRHDHCVWRLDGIGRSQPSRPAGLPLTNCAVKVLIAAITVTMIRDGRTSIAGACRAWTKLEAADDRPRERKGTNRSAQFRRPTRLAAADAVQPPHGLEFSGKRKTDSGVCRTGPSC